MVTELTNAHVFLMMRLSSLLHAKKNDLRKSEWVDLLKIKQGNPQWRTINQLLIEKKIMVPRLIKHNIIIYHINYTQLTDFIDEQPITNFFADYFKREHHLLWRIPLIK